MHDLPQPVKLWYWGPYFRHERPQAGRYPPVLPARRRGDRLRLAARRRRADRSCSTSCCEGSASRGWSCGSRASARPRTRAEYREELQAYLRAHEGELSRDVRERIDANPLRAFDSDDEGDPGGDGRGADDARPPRRRGRRALRRGPAPARRRRVSTTRSTARSFAASTTTPAPCSSSTATGSARSRGSAAAGATTAWSSSSAAPPTPGRRLGGGGRADPARARLPSRAAAVDVFVVADGGGARARAGAGGRAAPRRDLGRPRPRRPQRQGTDEAGRPPRRAAGRDPRAEGRGASCATWRAASSASWRWRPRRGAARAMSESPADERSRVPAAAARTRTATRWCGQVLADRVGADRPGRRLGPPPRDHGGLIFVDLRDRTGLVQLVFNPDAAGEAHALGRAAARRGRDQRRRRGRAPQPRDRQPRAPDGRGRGAWCAEVELLADAETPPFQIEGYLGRGRGGAAAALPLPRPAPRRRCATRSSCAPAVDRVDPRVPRRRGLRRDRDADPHPLDPGGRARLPRPEPAPARRVLRAAAVAAALQAAADGRRLRALLPDRPLLSRRGFPRRPPARLHPARPGDVVRRASRT